MGRRGGRERGRDRRFGWWLALIGLVGLAVRVGYVLISQVNHLPLHGDAFIYNGGANLLVRGRPFVEPLSVFRTIPTAAHPPLYWLWLSIASAVDPAAWTSQETHLLWSCVLGTGTVVLCGLAGREIAGRRIGLLAAALAAVYPGLWIEDGGLRAETMAMFTSAAVILFAYRYWNRPSVWRVAWLGVWCALAALSRSELVLSVVFVLVPLVLLTRSVSWPRRLRWIATGGVVMVLVIAPWTAYNLGRFEEPVYLSTGFGRTMAASNCESTFYGDYVGFKSYACLTAASHRSVTREMDESQQDKALRKVATDYIREHPTRLPLVVLARWGRILQVYEPRQEIPFNNYYSSQGAAATELQFVTFYLAVAAAVVGAVMLRRRRIPIFPLVAFPVMVLIAVGLTFAQWRYRAPAEPALVLFAAVPLDWLLRRVAPPRPAANAPEPAPDVAAPLPVG